MSEPIVPFGTDTGIVDVNGNPICTGFVDMSNDDYHASAGISKTHLDTIWKHSPRHYWHRYVNPNREPEEKTPALINGSAIHTAALEWERFKRYYVETPTFNRRLKTEREAYNRFIEGHAGQIALGHADYEMAVNIRRAISRHPVASGLLSGGFAEQSCFAIDPDTGELIKCQPDYISADFSYAVDLKTTNDASPTEFARSVANYRYPVQEAWYRRVIKAAVGVEPEKYVFIAVEKEEPYAIGIYTLTRSDVNIAAAAAQRDFDEIVKHRALDQWPDYGYQINELVLPTWTKM